MIDIVPLCRCGMVKYVLLEQPAATSGWMHTLQTTHPHIQQLF